MSVLGTVARIRRYPVKSMQGEELTSAVVDSRGLTGDRRYAVYEPETGRVASPKVPRKWARLLDFSAAYPEPPSGNGVSPARITFPEGPAVAADDPEVHALLSRALGRDVRLISEVPEKPRIEHAAPSGDPIDFEKTEDFPVINPFFDFGGTHLLTSATLAHLKSLYPDGTFDVLRYRPNFVIETPAGVTGFAENDWHNKIIAVGEEVRLRIIMPTVRCVVTTLPQAGLPQDPQLLRTIQKHNNLCVGVYGAVVQPGTVRLGDELTLADG